MTEKIIPINPGAAPAAADPKSLIPDEKTASRAVLPFPNSTRIYVKGSRADIEVPMRDTVADPSAREELVRVGGKAQVPCLFIDGEPLYESADIIAYFAAHRA